jgi:hypothetical protein
MCFLNFPVSLYHLFTQAYRNGGRGACSRIVLAISSDLRDEVKNAPFARPGKNKIKKKYITCHIYLTCNSILVYVSRS